MENDNVLYIYETATSEIYKTITSSDIYCYILFAYNVSFNLGNINSINSRA